MLPPTSRCTLAICRRAIRRPLIPTCLPQSQSRIFFFSSSSQSEIKPTIAPKQRKELLDIYTKCDPINQPPTPFKADNLLKDRSSFDLPRENGQNDQYVGFIGKHRNVSKKLSFADLILPNGTTIQLCSKAELDLDAHKAFRLIPAHSPVLVHVHREEPSPDSKQTFTIASIQPLNSFPKNIIVTPETVFKPKQRHLQIRFHPELQARLRFRSWLKVKLNQGLLDKGFTDVETPTLFKSTPEGAREFLVPTRRRGKAYALTQSPQQYKQVLIASGIGRYMQWARCYRDEDSRADRQPEFSQLDMEWAFADAEKVRSDVNDILLKALEALRPAHSYQDIRGERVPVVSAIPDGAKEPGEHVAHNITTMTFAEAISAYGVDKPDLRIPGRIQALSIPDSANDFVGMITDLEDPLVEAFTFSLNNDISPSESLHFVKKFMNSLPASLSENPDGQPQIIVYDSSKPLNGFSSIGFEYETLVTPLGGQELKDGDLVIFQARKRHEGQYTSTSTKIGEFRSLLWKALVEEDLMTKPRLGDPRSLQFVWVTEFPMFKPLGDDEGWKASDARAGITSCHHPFTAPLTPHDLELLFTTPLEAKSAAYDLVLNGVEVGGGSERNHIASIQEFIMRDVLDMSSSRIHDDFGHLFQALEAGCPPHAGFALGFDRLVALLSGTGSVRDVIAFPKTMRGEDLFVGSPGDFQESQFWECGLRVSEEEGNYGDGRNENKGSRQVDLHKDSH